MIRRTDPVIPEIWDITDPVYKKQASLFNSSWRNLEPGEQVIVSDMTKYKGKEKLKVE